jgi:hypothetical protein
MHFGLGYGARLKLSLNFTKVSRLACLAYLDIICIASLLPLLRYGFSFSICSCNTFKDVPCVCNLNTIELAI